MDMELKVLLVLMVFFVIAHFVHDFLTGTKSKVAELEQKLEAAEDKTAMAEARARNLQNLVDRLQSALREECRRNGGQADIATEQAKTKRRAYDRLEENRKPLDFYSFCQSIDPAEKRQD